MDAKLIAALACGAALALGACSGGTPATSTTPATGGPADPGGETQTPAGEFDAALKDAQDKLKDVRQRVMDAVADAGRAVTNAAKEEARREIDRLREALGEAVERARTLTAPSDDETRQYRAIGVKAVAESDLEELTLALDGALDSLAWYRQRLARYRIPNGAAMPPRSGRPGGKANVEIERIDRTITVDGTVTANDKAFDSNTFETVMYAHGKELFSVDGDEFKVGGYVGTDDGVSDPQPYTHAGLKLTSDGIVIRTGGSPPTSNSNPGVWLSDFTDTRRDITASGNDGGPPHGDNAWDLVLTFGAPQTMSVLVGAPSRNLQSDWTGNGSFYWRSYVPAADSQLKADGEYYAANAFNQPEGYKDLGTYEVWLSNYLGVLDRGLEPEEGSGAVRCPDGTMGTSCPFDDTHHYLKYAAYGLFVYSADRQTYLSFANGQKGRIHAMHFGYSAFAGEDGKRTTDIGTAVTSANFRGHTLAYAVTGSNQAGGVSRDSKLLRGDAALTVSIPSAGSGRIGGNLANFEEWTGSRWRPLTSGFGVTLQPTVISNYGTFSGAAVPTGDTIRNRGNSAPEDFPARTSFSTAGGIVSAAPAFPFIGVFNGSFYGPRDDSADLEVAGSWQLVGSVQHQWEVYGSFGAKQKPAAASGS